MSKTYMAAAFIAWAILAVLVPDTVLAATPARRAWLTDWEKKNPIWRAIHCIGPRPERLAMTEKFISEVLHPMGFNLLSLEIDYGIRLPRRTPKPT